jgi:Flp pilus assembly pilin Flp
MRILPRILRFVTADDGHSAVEHAAVIAFVLTVLIVGVRTAGDVVQVFKTSGDAIAASDTGLHGSRSTTSRRRATDENEQSSQPSMLIQQRRDALRVAAARARRRTEFQQMNAAPAEAGNAPTARFAEHRRPDVDPIR